MPSCKDHSSASRHPLTAIGAICQFQNLTLVLQAVSFSIVKVSGDYRPFLLMKRNMAN
jgi:hypothetical protein